MMRRRSDRRSEPTPEPPAWRARFDAAATLIRSRQQPAWIEDRLADVEAALSAADVDVARLSRSIDHLDPASTTAQLKDALRTSNQRLPTAQDVDGPRRLEALRRRFDTVNELMNRRSEIERRVADSLADLELLAVEAVRPATEDAAPLDGVDDALGRLEVDLTALQQARAEVRSW